jgi:cell division protein FtsW
MSRKISINKRRKKGKHAPDYFILTFALALSIFGAIMIFDASVYKAHTVFGDQFYFLKSQLIWLLIGTIVALPFYLIDYKKILKFAVPAMGFVIASLFLVLFIGEDINGSKRWFQIGPLPAIQPAEFAKIVIIIYLSSWLAKQEHKYKSLKDFFKGFASFGAILGIVAILILLEPDLGTTMVICMTAFAMFFISGKDKIHTWGSISILLLGIPLAVLAGILEPYRFERIKTFLDLLLKGEVTDPKGSGYQIQQILIGIGSGGFWGKGFGQSRQRFGYLVENTAFTDSIFAVILEEFGLLGGIVLIALWTIFLWKGIDIAERVEDKQGRFLATGVTIWLALQAFLNMSANVGIIPLTGIPLPFLTYGGSNTFVTLVGIALLLNVSRHTNGAKKKIL